MVTRETPSSPIAPGRLRCEIRVDLDAVDGAGQVREAGGEETAPGADLERALAAHRRQRLQDAAFQRRREHELAVADRDRRVGKGDATVGLGHETLARDGTERREHARVEHGPRAYLLVDHLPPGGLGFGVHGVSIMVNRGGPQYKRGLCCPRPRNVTKLKVARAANSTRG